MVATQIAEVQPDIMHGLKQIYVQGSAPQVDTAQRAEQEIGGRLLSTAALDEGRRRHVVERDRQQIAGF